MSSNDYSKKLCETSKTYYNKIKKYDKSYEVSSFDNFSCKESTIKQ